MIQGKYAIGQNDNQRDFFIVEFWEGGGPPGSCPYRGGFPTEEAAVMREEETAKANGWEMTRLTRYDEEKKMAV